MTAAIQHLKRWFAEPVESLFAQVPRALAASGFSALLDFALLFMLVETAGWQPLPAAIVGYLGGGVLQYILCSYWVFQNAPKGVASGFLVFTVLSLVGLVITWLTMATLHDFAGVHYTFAKVLALGFAFSWNFLSRKFLIFRTEPVG